MAPEHIRVGLTADYMLVEAIEKELREHKGQNPLDDPEINRLIDVAIKTWDDPSIGQDRSSYLINFFLIFPYIKDNLAEAGYYSDIEVTVEPNSSNNSPESAIDLSGDSQTS